MDGEPKSSIPKKPFADKLCRYAIACILFGIFLSVFCMFLAYITRHDPDTLILFGGLLISFTFIYLFAPIFGIFAIVYIIVQRKIIVRLACDLSGQERIRATANKFIVASLLLSSMVLLPVMYLSFSERTKDIMMPTSYSIALFLISLIALTTALISLRLLKRISANIPVRIGSVFSIVLSIVAITVDIGSTTYVDYFLQSFRYSRTKETFSGSSDSLKRTTIVPTLDSPCPKNKNVIWCSSFQLAWNQMKEDVIGAPVQVVGAEELAARLNYAEQSASDLESRSFYAAAGRINQGIIGKIQKDMGAKFPSHSVPDFSDFADIPQGILAYSYLIANVPFKYPYRQVEGDFIFTDSNGIETNVGAFGVWGYGSQYKRIREQAEVLYFVEDVNEPNRDLRMKEFAVDLCKYSEPYQVVVAIVEPKESLAQTLKYIHNQIEDFKQTDNYQKMSFLGGVDVLMVPEMFWEIDHRFDELVGKIVANANPAMPILEASQGIRFKLDRYGAALESEAAIMVAAIPRHFMFNRPFLVYMKKRDSEQPFFVMWVDNAELLNKK